MILHLGEDLLKKVIEMLLNLRLRDITEMGAVRCLRAVLRILVHVQQDDGLAEGGFVVDSRAAIAMTAGSDFEIEGAVHLVLFRPED